MNRLAPLALLLPLVGCDYIEQGKDIFEGLTNPLVVQGMILGIEPPDSEDIDLSGSDYSEGTTALVFLADAANADELENAPVSGADVSLRGGNLGDEGLADMGAGAYALALDPGVVYADGAQWTVVVGLGSDTARAEVTLPAGANLTIDEEHTQGAPLTVNLSSGGYDSALVVVIDGQNQEVTYSNEPSGIKEIYDFTHSTETVGVVEIPGTAFPDQSVYAVGIAGMNNTTSEDLENMNTALSSVMSGKMVFSAVSTIELPD